MADGDSEGEPREGDEADPENEEEGEAKLEKKPSRSDFGDSDGSDAEDLQNIYKMAEQESLREQAEQLREKKRILLKKSLSDRHIPKSNAIPQKLCTDAGVHVAEQRVVSLATSQSAPCLEYPLHESRKQIPSQFISAPSYSFGKIATGVGKFRIPPIDVRTNYLKSAPTPGVGSYNMDKPLPGPITAPKHSFCLSGTLRDTMIRRKSQWGHVLHNSTLNNPGPGEYFGGEKNSLMWEQPSYTFGYRRPKIKGYWTIPTPGPDAYTNEVIRESCGNQLTRPKWQIVSKRTDEPREKRSCFHSDISTGKNIGPGAYRHPTCLVTREDVDYKHR